jgi:phosphatidylglycerophosphate synthase
VALLAALFATTGLDLVGAAVGLAFGGAVAGLLGRGLARADAGGLGPADRVTLARAVLVGGVAALVAGSILRPVPGDVLAVLSAVALALDAVDGRVARATGTASPLGARFDVEVDSALVFVLSLSVARWLGPWVLLPGSAHYLLLAAARALPWLRRPAPPRPWCKVVAVVQGGTLALLVTGLVPPPVAVAALAGGAVLLAESFGREVWWLWRHRGPVDARGLPAAALGPAGG